MVVWIPYDYYKGGKPNFEMQNEIRVPHVFQVFPEVSKYLVLNMNILSYSIHCNVVKEVIYAILEIYLSEKIGPNQTQCVRSDIF